MKRTIPVKAEEKVKSYQAVINNSVEWVWRENRQLANASWENSLDDEGTVNRMKWVWVESPGEFKLKKGKPAGDMKVIFQRVKACHLLESLDFFYRA